MTSSEVLKFAKEQKAEMLDLKFMDFPGIWQHFTVPISELEEDSFENGFGFDGSSIRGWQPINASDMLVVPDPATCKIDPFLKPVTLTMICNIIDPITHEPYSRDPRNIAKKAENYLKFTGIADTAYFGPEAEFFIFDDVRFDSTANSSFYILDSKEGAWNSGSDEQPNLGYKPRFKEGYFPVLPTDSMHNVRTQMVLTLLQLGIEVEAHHHEVATAGQSEIDIKFSPLVQMADNLMWFKYVVKNVAREHNKTATFMPKPIYGDNGSGMHVHVSLWKQEKNLFYGGEYAGLSKDALYFIGGLLKHGKSLTSITNPTTNSFKRLVPGFEAPINLAYSSRNRSAAIRIPMYSTSPKSKRVEFRTPDSSCNGYLAFAAILMAGLDGIANKIDPGEPLDKDIYGLAPRELKNIQHTPRSLDEAMDALENDNAYLRKGDVFTDDVISTWLDYKRKHEITPILSRPVPYEFVLYFDI